MHINEFAVKWRTYSVRMFIHKLHCTYLFMIRIFVIILTTVIHIIQHKYVVHIRKVLFQS